MNFSPPSTQKAGERPISFLLDDGLFPTAVDLVIRPEDLTRTDPSRVNVQQTLGGVAWADNFGPGLPQISISGHTGWRRTESSDMDGVDRFQFLNDYVFTKWHEKRKSAAKAGDDPDKIKLIFSDALDGFSVSVIPMTFTLRRSRSRPLLCQYQISLTVIGDAADQQGYLSMLRKSPKSAANVESLGLDSLTASVDRITTMLVNVKSFITGTLLVPVTKFMQQTARLYSSVRGAVSAGSQIAGALISVARTTAMAGVNIFRTLAAVASIPALVKSQLMQVAGAYSNILCVLSNALHKTKFIQDYSDLYGSSNCSSTSGGRPLSTLAGQNPFYSVVPTRTPLPVSVSSSAQSSLFTLANNDTVLSPMPTDTLAGHVNAIATGMVVS